MVLRKLRFASSRCSAGELTLSAVVLCDRPDRPLVKSCGRIDIVLYCVGTPCGGNEYNLDIEKRAKKEEEEYEESREAVKI